MSSPTRLDTIVTRNLTLRQLFRQAATYQNLEIHIKPLLEEPLRHHIHLATLRGDTLTLIADSSAWAAKLRYQVPELRGRIAEISDFPKIQNIRVKVAKIDSPYPADPQQSKPYLSNKVIEGLQQQANYLRDPALREALLRLTKKRKR